MPDIIIGASIPPNPTFETVTLTEPIVNDTQATTKSYVDSVAQGLMPLASCVWATTADLGYTYVNGASGVGATLTAPANGAFTTDGLTPAQDTRGVVKDQADPAENGVYVLSTAGSPSKAAILTRATDYDTPAEMVKGTSTFVTSGTANSNSTFFQSTPDVVTVGTSAVGFSIQEPRLGDLALLNQVDTAQIVNNAVTQDKVNGATTAGFNLLTAATVNDQLGFLLANFPDYMNINIPGPVGIQEYVICQTATYNGSIASFSQGASAIGTAGDYTVKIDGVPVTGLTNVVNTTTNTTTSATALNVFTPTSKITVEIAGVVAVNDFSGTLNTIRT